MRTTLVFLLASIFFVSTAAAQNRHHAPPAKRHKHKKKHKKHKVPKAHPHGKKHRTAPEPEPKMPVRKPAKIDQITPTSGPPKCKVQIHGTHFDGTTKVRFNGRWVKVISRIETKLEVRIPRTAQSDHFVVFKAGFPDVTSKVFNVIRPPAIKRFRPVRGGAGTTVTIIGQHFLPADQFVIGDKVLRTVSFKHHRVVAVMPEDGAFDKIGVRRGGKVVARSKRPFDFIGQAPSIISFTPTRGSKGTVVRVHGKNFVPTDKVFLGGRPLPIKSRSVSSIEVLIKRHASGHFEIRGRHGRRAESTGTFTVLRPPIIKRFYPAFGPPGTRITIEGAGFVHGDEAYVGAAMLTIRTVFDRKIVAELPAGTTSGRVSVSRNNRKFFGRGGFEVIHPPVISAIDPRSAPAGSFVSITGRNFMKRTSVLLSGRKVKVIRRRSSEKIEFQVPDHSRTGEIVLVTRGGSAKSPFPFKVSRHAEVTSFFPLHGLPGAIVTFRGVHFHRGVEVVLSGQPCKIVHQGIEELKIEIPAKAKTGSFQIHTFKRQIKTRLKFKVDLPKPELAYTFEPKAGHRGSEVTLFLKPPRQGVMVFYNDRPLPKKVMEGGRRIVITIPGDARSGHFTLEFNKRAYKSKIRFRVR